MHSTNDFVSPFINPEALGEKERELLNQLVSILDDLLEELKSGEQIETVFVQAEVDDLTAVLTTLSECGMNYNCLLDLTEFGERRKELFEVAEKFRIEESNFANMVIQLGAFGAVLGIEFFRTLLLFIVAGSELAPEDPIGTVLWKLKKIAPNSSQKLEPHLDIEFRNSLAHGLFTQRGGKVILYKNAKFEILKEMDIAHFMIGIKRANVLSMALMEVFNRKVKSGFFS